MKLHECFFLAFFPLRYKKMYLSVCVVNYSLYFCAEYEVNFYRDEDVRCIYQLFT